MFYAIDGATLAIIGSTQVSGFPGGIALAPAMHRIYLTWECPRFCSSGYREIDDRTFEVARVVMTGASLVLPVLHPDGRLYVGAWTPNNEDEVLALDLDNHAPAVTSVSLSSSSPLTNDILHVTATASDPDFPTQPADALTYTFTWKVNAVIRSVTSGPDSSASFDLAMAGHGDRGDAVSVEVVASDSTMQSTVVSASAVVANTAPTVTLSLSDTSPQTRDVVVATATAQDADADSLALTYAWSVNGVVRQTGASNRFDLAVKGNGDNGDVVSVVATASDGTASASASASATVTQKKH